MQRIRRIAVRVALAVVFSVSVVTITGCALEDVLKGEVSEFESVVPEGNGEINGFLSGVGSDKSVDASGVVQAVRIVGVRWDVGASDTEFLLAPETAMLINGRDLSSATTTEKAAALGRLNLDGATTPVYVRYQTTPRSPDQNELGRGYPVALRIEVTPTE